MTNEETRSDDDAPLDDLAEEVLSKPDSTDEAWDAFTEEEFEQVDTEDIWTDVPSVGDDGETGDPSEGRSSSPTESENGEETIIPKRSYCMRCKHFDRPPNVKCNADGSRIIEFVTMSDVRVAGCPVVDGRHDILNQP